MSKAEAVRPAQNRNIVQPRHNLCVVKAVTPLDRATVPAVGGFKI